MVQNHILQPMIVGALELQTGIQVLNARRDIFTTNMYENLRRLDVKYWTS